MASISNPFADSKAAQSGLLAGFTAYAVWGFQPLLFKWLGHVEAPTIVANRAVWSLILVAVILLAARRMGEVQVALRDPATLRIMALSSLILASNWLIYVYAVETSQVLEASFGYFINPLMNIAIGMVFFGERQNRWQVVSIGIAIVAIAIQAWGLGGVPIIALSLAVTFAAYGYLRRMVKASSAAGLFAETLLIIPVAIAYLGYTFIGDGGIGPHGDPGTLGLLILTGPMTTFTLLLFAYAMKRVRFTTMGMLQYIAPSTGFLLAITLFGEHLNTTRLVSFGLIWLSLLIYSFDSMMRRRVVVSEPPA